MAFDPERAFRLHWEEGLSWATVTKCLPTDLTPRGVKSAAWRWEREHPDVATPLKRAARGGTPQLTAQEGVRAGEATLLDEEAIVKHAFHTWRATQRLQQRRDHQRLTFDHGPVALVEIADVHLGGTGVNYPRAFREAELIRDTPGMYAVFAGDIVDNFIIGSLRRARDNSRLAIVEEWVLAKRYLSILKNKLVAVVAGNHDQWVKKLAGIDYFREVVAGIRKDVLYDSDDARLTVQVGDWEIPVRIRHKWKGSSIYNPTHGIERSAKFDRRFLIGMGAHTHVSGLTRSFNVEGRTGLAMLAGAYKRVDAYARELGLPAPNQSTAVTVIIDDEDRSLTGFDNLETAARYLSALYT